MNKRKRCKRCRYRLHIEARKGDSVHVMLLSLSDHRWHNFTREPSVKRKRTFSYDSMYLVFEVHEIRHRVLTAGWHPCSALVADLVLRKSVTPSACGAPNFRYRTVPLLRAQVSQQLVNLIHVDFEIWGHTRSFVETRNKG